MTLEPDLSTYILLLLVWLSSASATGLLLALLARRIHPSLSLPRLWVFYSVLMGFLVAAVFLVGLF